MKLTLDSWQKVIDSVLRPARPHLERCLGERENHLVARRLVTEERGRALKDCEHRIERARGAVFAANDGVVTARMTNLEREWRTLSRIDPDAGLMDLWARIAPPAWLDRKLWRDSDSDRRVDAAIALAADVEGVEVAESAVHVLRPNARLRFRLAEQDSEHVRLLYPEAAHLEGNVHAAALARFPDRPLLARDIAHAAFLESTSPGMARPLIELWKTGYVLAAIDATSVTLEIAAL